MSGAVASRCLFRHEVWRSTAEEEEEGGREEKEALMINHQRGLCDADSITSLDCSSVGKVRLSIGGL